MFTVPSNGIISEVICRFIEHGAIISNAFIELFTILALVFVLKLNVCPLSRMMLVDFVRK